MCQPSDRAICMRAGYRFSAASASTSMASPRVSACGTAAGSMGRSGGPRNVTRRSEPTWFR
jgi:hypothetical protein